MPDLVILVIYDIKDNRLRFKVSNFLRRSGYVRIQKSVFVFPFNPVLLSDTEAGLRKILRENNSYDIQIYVFLQASFDNRIVLSKGYYIEEEEFLV